MFVITPTSGCAIRASSPIWPMPRIAISSTISSTPCEASSTVSGRPISVLQFSRLACARPPSDRVQHREQDVLGRGLAGRARDADHAAAARAQRDEPRARRGRRAPASGSSAAKITRVPVAGRSLRIAGGDHHAPGAGLDRLRARTRRRRHARPRARRTDRRARRCASRSTARAGRSRRTGVVFARDQAGAGGGRDLGRRQLDHAARRASARSASRATSRSSNGTLRPPSNSWPCSCPLPAIRTMSPARACSTARSIAARRSGSISSVRARAGRLGALRAFDDRGDDRVRVLRARVVGGHDHAVGEPSCGLAHQGPLLAVAIAARAEHAHQPPCAGLPEQLAGGGQHVLERIGRVRVVHEHAEPLALLHRLEAAGHARRRRQRGGRVPHSDTERARPRPAHRARSTR